MSLSKIQFYNTLSRKKENFSPINSKEVLMYSCGPTVYNYPHIGNYRAYIFADILKRVLLYNNYNVKHIMNLTDIDDKTIRESQREGKSLKDFTEFYTQEFYKDVKTLNILPPVKYTKATDYIDKMVEIIEKLLSNGVAYESDDGNVYFNIKKFKNYGKLANIKIEDQKKNASGRIKTDEYDKDNIQDFALWKSWNKDDGEVFWDPSTWLGVSTSLGKGRPGWHIECSAMSMAELAQEIDIHTGGVDNIFPHHENEIAQSEGATNKNFVKYWMHNEWVLVDKKKMAKSEGNFYTLRDLIKRDIDPIAYRFWLLMANYRTRVNFVWEAIEASQIALKRLYSLYLELPIPSGEVMGQVSEEYKAKFTKHINNDLNTPRALSLLWDLLKDKNVSPADKKATILDFDRVLGLGFMDVKKEKIPEKIEKLLKKREQARKDKNFKKSDSLREQINTLGYEVKDRKNKQEVSKI